MGLRKTERRLLYVLPILVISNTSVAASPEMGFGVEVSHYFYPAIFKPKGGFPGMKGLSGLHAGVMFRIGEDTYLRGRLGYENSHFSLGFFGSECEIDAISIPLEADLLSLTRIKNICNLYGDFGLRFSYDKTSGEMEIWELRGRADLTGHTLGFVIGGGIEKSFLNRWRVMVEYGRIFYAVVRTRTDDGDADFEYGKLGPGRLRTGIFYVLGEGR